jgi:hypothetical protein
MKDMHLAIVTDTETGLFHGAVYRNHPTPSGCDRWLLQFTTQEGFGNERDAAQAINKAADQAFPNVERLDLDTFPPVEDADVSQLNFPVGSWITEVIPKDKKYPKRIEVRFPGETCWGPAKREITEAQRRMLQGTGRIILDGGSVNGGDDELQCFYGQIWQVVK